jgi:hypothetical protein
MDVFTMVAVIVVVCTVAGVYNNHLKSKNEQVGQGASESVAQELDALRQRVEVLESIVTDEKYQLHRELSELEKRA